VITEVIGLIRTRRVAQVMAAALNARSISAFLNAIEAASIASASIGPLTIWSMNSLGMLGSTAARCFLLVLIGIHAPSR